MPDDPARSEHYATQAVVAAAVRLVSSARSVAVWDPGMRQDLVQLRAAVDLWQTATGGDGTVVVGSPPVTAVGVRPGDTLVIGVPDGPDGGERVRELAEALPGVDVVLFAGTIEGHTRPEADDDGG